MRYVVIYEQGLNEGRAADVVCIRARSGWCVSGGETRAECERMIREAMELHLEGLREKVSRAKKVATGPIPASLPVARIAAPPPLRKGR